MKTTMTCLAACAILLSATLWNATAYAHAFLDHADPRVGATVERSPVAVTLTFSEPVEPEFCRVEVFDAQGRAVSSGPLDHPQPGVLRLSITPLPPGEYTVRWAVTSVDTHQTEGRFDFTVAP
jgi:methionine-rich copper-binding protein CopC